MSRHRFTMLLVILLAISTLVGVVSPASAASVQTVATVRAEGVAPTQNTEVVSGDDSLSPDAAASAGSGERWIEVDLTQRRLYAHEGNRIVLTSLVSIGKPSTPTVTGTFRIYAKLRSTRMRGPGYNLPNVPHTMYFYRGYAIHGAYWVKTFGTRISHGCVNVNLKDAAWLFNWASVGTRVVIHK